MEGFKEVEILSAVGLKLLENCALFLKLQITVALSKKKENSWGDF